MIDSPIPNEVEGVSSHPASETVIQPLVFAHRERRRLLLVEGAQPQVSGPFLAQGSILRHHLYNVRSRLDFFDAGILDERTHESQAPRDPVGRQRTLRGRSQYSKGEAGSIRSRPRLARLIAAILSPAPRT